MPRVLCTNCLFFLEIFYYFPCVKHLYLTLHSTECIWVLTVTICDIILSQVQALIMKTFPLCFVPSEVSSDSEFLLVMWNVSCMLGETAKGQQISKVRLSPIPHWSMPRSLRPERLLTFNSGFCPLFTENPEGCSSLAPSQSEISNHKHT